jgi:Ca-activated chloride channel family protein
MVSGKSSSDIYQNYNLENTDSIIINIEKEDNLYEDNKFYITNNIAGKKKVLLISSGNTFLEKALRIQSNIELYIADGLSSIDESQYSLIIFDGQLTEKLPEMTDYIVFNPPEKSIFSDTELNIIDTLEFRNTEFWNKYMGDIEKYQFNIYSSRYLKSYENPKVLINGNEKPVAIYNENENRRSIIFGFDLHLTDFILKPAFPVFITNIINDFLETSDFYNKQYFCNDLIEFRSKPATEKVNIISPADNVDKYKTSGRIIEYNKTTLPGFYIINEVSKKELSSINIPVNIPEKESRHISVGTYIINKVEKGFKGAANQNNINSILIILMLILLTLEWWVYIYDI